MKRNRRHTNTGRQAIEIINLRAEVRSLNRQLRDEYRYSDKVRSDLYAEKQKNHELFVELCSTTTQMGQYVADYERRLTEKNDKIIDLLERTAAQPQAATATI